MMLGLRQRRYATVNYAYGTTKLFIESRDWLIELISPPVNQIVTSIDITVRIAATIPIVFDSGSALFKYFHVYQNPNGGKNKLTEYTIIFFNNVVASGLSFSCFPQLEQKYAVVKTANLHEGQVASDWFSIYSFYQKTALSATSSYLIYKSFLYQLWFKHIRDPDRWGYYSSL